MAIGRTNCGVGGVGLNFQVVGGTTQPTSPKENTIWVNTSTEITGYAFSATQPENPINGMVWITIAASSVAEFNALKKNSIQVYPLRASQYISDAWTQVTATSYQSGEWVGWILYLYQPGNEFSTVTGGWTSSEYTYEGRDIASATKTDNYMEFLGNEGTTRLLGTNYGINVDKFSTLHVDAEVTGSYNSVSMYMAIRTGSKNGTKIGGINFRGELVRSVWTFDLTSVSGDIYLLNVAQSASECKGRIYNIWLT